MCIRDRRIGLLSLARYLAVLAQFWTVAAGVGIAMSFFQIAAAAPLGQLAGMAGFTPGALGIQEAGWLGAFTWVGLDAVAIGLFVLSQRLIITAYFSVLSLLSWLLLRRTRAAALNMIPTGTRAAASLGLVMPHLDGRLEGLAVKVPTPDVSIVDLTATLRADATPAAIDAAFRAATELGPLAPYLEVLDAELVSADLVGSTASCLYDPFLTKVLGPRLVKVFGWYDNEWSYAARLKDLCLFVLERRGR